MARETVYEVWQIGQVRGFVKRICAEGRVFDALVTGGYHLEPCVVEANSDRQ